MKYVYEFIGTFFLVFTVGMVSLNPNSIGLWAPLAVATVLAVMVFAGGHVSGGHYNPAVSLAVFMRNRLTINDLWVYWGVQFAAGIVAALLTLYFKGASSPTALEPDYLKALIGEFLFTFALCYVVLNVATAKETANNSYFGWAIGFTVLAGAYVVGTISNAAFNPAVALGLTILNLSHWYHIWIYLVANLLGAAVAALVFNAAHPNEIERENIRSWDEEKLNR
jgi:aquaporin Z